MCISLYKDTVQTDNQLQIAEHGVSFLKKLIEEETGHYVNKKKLGGLQIPRKKKIDAFRRTTERCEMSKWITYSDFLFLHHR